MIHSKPSRPQPQTVVIDLQYETTVLELELIKELLQVLTKHDLLQLTKLDFCLESALVLSKYMDMKAYNFTVIDELASLIRIISDSQEPLIDFTFLKRFLLDYLFDRQYAIGFVTIFTSFKLKDYQEKKDAFGDNMLAFVRDLVDDSQFNIWYVDYLSDLRHTKNTNIRRRKRHGT